jgi:hypothetical protein
MTCVSILKCRGLQDRLRPLEFSFTSPTEGGHTQYIRERFLPPFSPGFWDRVGFLFIVGLHVHKRPERGMSVGLGQINANNWYQSQARHALLGGLPRVMGCQRLAGPVEAA